MKCVNLLWGNKSYFDLFCFIPLKVETFFSNHSYDIWCLPSKLRAFPNCHAFTVACISFGVKKWVIKPKNGRQCLSDTMKKYSHSSTKLLHFGFHTSVGTIGSNKSWNFWFNNCQIISILIWKNSSKKSSYFSSTCKNNGNLTGLRFSIKSPTRPDDRRRSNIHRPNKPTNYHPSRIHRLLIISHTTFPFLSFDLFNILPLFHHGVVSTGLPIALDSNKIN